ncbi:hypothetical protein QBC39DRAFT_310097 [Podospora conica]|nr:hypothetical protein QBC39DRAFT_310097 [Schizothecium conicum]
MVWNHPTKPCDWDLEDDSDAESGFGATTLPARSFIPTPGSEANFRARPQVPTNPTTDDHDDFVCAISESRSGDVIGVAIINITTGQANLVRILNDNKYQRLVDTLSTISHPPQCFLVLSSVSEKGSKSLLVPCLEVEFPSVPRVAVPRAHWNEADGLAMVDSLALRNQVKALRASLDNNFYVSCAFCAAMTYIREQLNLSFGHHSMRITYTQPSDSMALDRVTITSLELLENIRPTKFKGSTLFGILNSTRTPQGRRLLRSSLLQPSTDEKQITERYDAVEELVANEELFLELGKCLRGLLQIDIERLAMWIDFTTRQPRVSLEDQLVLSEGHHHLPLPSHQELQSAEQELNNILSLKQYLVGIGAIHDALASAECRSRLCSRARFECSNESIGLINGLIEANIEKDAVYSKAPIDVRNNRLWAIKSPSNGVLEQARKLFKEHTNELNSYFDTLNKQFSETLGSEAGLHLDSNRHYYLKFQWTDVEREITKSQAAIRSGESGFRQLTIAGVAIVNGVRKKNTYQCQTMELIQRSRAIQLQADLVTMQSDKIVVELKKSLSQHAGALLEVGEAIATLDMLCSFVQLSTTQNYVRPIVSNTLVLQQARHPIMDVRKANFVPNDAYSGSDGHRFQVITGSNMSGKSTFIKSVALIQILAQMGCFVPAQYASISICDRLFTRLSTEDKPESNLGTFAVEMREMNLILRQATKDSMVIIDELGRGTSPQDGLSVALAMSERLIDIGSRVFFATHFTKLARILNLSRANSVLNIHLSAESTTNGETRQITLPHTVNSGPVKNEDYGLDLASRFFPPRIIRNAEKVSEFLRGVDADKKPGPETQTYKQNRLVMALPEILQQANDSSMDDAALVSYLNRLCIEFTTRMDQIDQEDDIDLDGEQGANPPKVPDLEKPDPVELETLMQRFRTEELRVMKNNVPRQPMSEISDATMSEATNRGRGQTVVSSVISEPRLPVPINRAGLIREQEALAAASTVSSVSFSVAGGDGDDDEMMWTSSPSGF